jgi:hypothetical protein
LTGRVVNPRHPLHGERLAGRVLVLPQGRGSCTTSNILLELIRTDQAPVAIVKAYERIRTGDWLVVDASAGEVRRRAGTLADSRGLHG